MGAHLICVWLLLYRHPGCQTWKARVAQSEYRLATVSDIQRFNLGSRKKTSCSLKPSTGSGAQRASYSMDNGVIS